MSCFWCHSQVSFGYWSWGVTYTAHMCQERLLPEAWSLPQTAAMCPRGRGFIWLYFYPLMLSSPVRGFALRTVMNPFVSWPQCNNTQAKVHLSPWMHRQGMRLLCGHSVERELKRQGALTALLTKASEGISEGGLFSSPNHNPRLHSSTQSHRLCTRCPHHSPPGFRASCWEHDTFLPRVVATCGELTFGGN